MQHLVLLVQMQHNVQERGQEDILSMALHQALGQLWLESFMEPTTLLLYIEEMILHSIDDFLCGRCGVIIVVCPINL